MILLFLFILGLAIGSFSNVLIDRLAHGESIMGRSHCDYCNRTLSAIDLVPVFSFLFLKGRCRTCKKKLSWQYTLIELLMGIIFVSTYQFVTISSGPLDTLRDVAQVVAWLGIMTSLVVILVTDAKYQIIPDSMQIALLVCSILLLGANGQLFAHPLAPLIAGICTLAPILALHVVTKGKGMGFGDVKFAFIMGFLLGIGKGFIALYIGFIVGAIVGVMLMVFGTKKLKSRIAFGPFLVIGLLVMLVVGDSVLTLVRRWYGI